MIDILIESTTITPFVKVSSEEGLIEIRGKSSPANSMMFYQPLNTKVKTLFSDVNAPIKVEIAFRYFNTSSSKCIFDFFKMLKQLKQEGKQVLINWHYETEDDDMRETGEDFADLLDLSFNFVEEEVIEETYYLQAV
jgi:SiaC family regulatory phosphoprotein